MIVSRETLQVAIDTKKGELDRRKTESNKEQRRRLWKAISNEAELPTSEDNEYKEKRALIKHLIKETFR